MNNMDNKKKKYRDIILRAWDRKEKKFIDCFNITDEGIPFRHTFDTVENLDVDLTEFVGVYDKNGRGIFEGDIVLAKYGNISYLREVIHKDAGFQFNPGSGFSLCNNNSDKFLIIGNIFNQAAIMAELKEADLKLSI